MRKTFVRWISQLGNRNRRLVKQQMTTLGLFADAVAFIAKWLSQNRAKVDKCEHSDVIKAWHLSVAWAASSLSTNEWEIRTASRTNPIFNKLSETVASFSNWKYNRKVLVDGTWSWQHRRNFAMQGGSARARDANNVSQYVMRKGKSPGFSTRMKKNSLHSLNMWLRRLLRLRLNKADWRRTSMEEKCKHKHCSYF